MTDAEYLFKQTSMERKRDGRGTYSKKRQGGKTVRFPSDLMSRKEKAKLNGEVKAYRFRDPLSWKEFRGMPRDLQQEYLDLISEKFPGVLNTMVATSLGATVNSLNQYLSKHKLKIKRPDGWKPDAKKFNASEDGVAWSKWNGYDKVEGEKTDPTDDEQAVVEAAEENVEVTTVNENDIENFIMALRMLKGTGAKVTIEVTL